MLVQQLPWTELESGETPMDGSSKIKGQGAASNPSKMEPFFSLEKLDHSLKEDQEAQDISPSNENHICKFCKKQFSSGRALGGHMRAHGSVFIQSEAAPAPAPAPWITSLESNPDKEQLNSSGRHASCIPSLHEMEGNSAHVLDSPDSSPLYPSGEDHIGSAKSTAKDESLKSSDAREDDEEASVKGSGSLVLNYSDLEAADDGSLAYNASDSEFLSRKELGLHKKAQQLYTLRRNPRPSKRFKDEEYAMELVPSAAARKSVILMAKTADGYQCTECGRGFVSSKALFGHMRCHPEREWRGIHRPKGEDKSIDFEIKNPQSSSNILWQNSPSQSGDHMINLNSKNESDAESIEAAYMHGEFKCNLQNWMRGKRSKRSRQSLKPLQTIPLQKFELGQLNTPLGIKEDKDMADCLVLLAYAGKVQEELEPAKKRAAFGLVNGRERSKHIKAGSEDEEAELEAKKDWNRSKLDSSNVWREESSQFEEFDEVGEKQEAGEIDADFKYECHSCKRVFKSHQALGGHRASHRKVKGCFARAHASDRWPYSPEEDLSEEDLPNAKPNFQTNAHRHPIRGIDGENAKANKLKKRSKSGLMKRIKGHECSICHKIFQSGQALGGHKRCHWGGTASSDTSTPHSFSQKHQMGSLEKGRNSREELLDLNLPAPEEEADDSTLDFKATSTTTHMPFNLSKFNPNINTLNENCPLGYDAHNMESSTSSDYKFSKKPSNSNGKHCVAEDVDSASQEFMLADHADSSAFHPWYVQHNIYDQVSTSIPNLKNHERKYTSTIASVAGLTPISA